MRWIASLFLGLLVCIRADVAVANGFSLFIDADTNASTGCSVVATDGSAISGIEHRLDIAVDGSTPPAVVSATRRQCAAGAFGPSTALSGADALGVNSGLGGADVIEFDESLAALGLPSDAVVNLYFQAGTPQQGASPTFFNIPQATIAGSAGGVLAVPTLPQAALAVLVFLLLTTAVRYLALQPAHFHSLVLVLGLFCAVGVSAVAGLHQSDGAIGDWAGEQPQASSAAGGSNSPATDVRQLFTATELGSLFVRIDVTELENPPAPLLVLGGPAGSPASTPVAINSATGSVVTLSAPLSGGAAPFTFQWQQLSGPSVALTGNGTDTVTFPRPIVSAPQQYVFQVTVVDANGSVGTKQFTVTVQPDAVDVTAGADFRAYSGQTVNLHSIGVGSGPSQAYSWRQVSPQTPAVTLNNASSANPGFVAPAVTISRDFVFEVTFDDGIASATDQVTVTVAPVPQVSNGAPMVIVGALQQEPLLVVATPSLDVSANSTQQLGSTARGGDGNYTWEWIFKGCAGASCGPFPKPTLLSAADLSALSVQMPDVTGLTTYAYEVRVTDGSGGVAVDSVSLFTSPAATPGARPLTVSSPPLIVDEGPLPVKLAANVTGGTAPYTYAWSIVTAPAGVSLLSADQPTALFVPPPVSAATTLTFRVTVTDALGTVQVRDVDAVVRDAFAMTPPLALSIQPIPTSSAVAGSTIQLPATASGGDGNYSYQWQQVSGTAAALSGDATAVLSVTTQPVTADDTLSFRVTVTDGASASSQLLVDVNVLGVPPISIDVIPAQDIDEGRTGVPVPAIVRGGSGSYSFSWTQVSGPAVTITDATQATALVDVPPVSADATAVLRLVVDDGVNPAVQQDVTLVIKDVPPALLPPKVQAPNGLTAQAGETLTLVAHGSGGDGNYSYQWRQVSGTTAILLGATSKSASITTPLLTSDETLTFEITVTDGVAQVASQTVAVDVTALAPIVLADAAQALFADENTAARVGVSATGGTGRYTYLWELVDDGGLSISLGGTTTDAVSFAAPEVLGKTQVSLRVTVSDAVVALAPAVGSAVVTINDLTAPLDLNLQATEVLAYAGQTVSLGVGLATVGGVPPYTYSWAQTGGTAVTLTDATAPNPSFTLPGISFTAALNFALTVTDAGGNSRTVNQQVKRAGKMFASIAPSVSVYTATGDPLTLEARVSNGVQPFSYKWSLQDDSSGNVIPDQATVNVTVPTTARETDWTVSLVVTDALGGTATASLTYRRVLQGNGRDRAAGSECMVCGDKSQNDPCSDLDLVLAITTKCPTTFPYWMNLIEFGAGNSDIKQYRSCVDEATVYHDWYRGSHDNALCMALRNNPDGTLATPTDPRYTNLSCNIGCYGDLCNVDSIPSRNTRYSPNY